MHTSEESANITIDNVGLVGPASRFRTFNLPFLDGVIRLSGSETGYLAALLEIQMRPNSGPDLHLHKNEDEIFFVLAGNYRVTIGTEVFECGPHDCIRVPRGAPHQLRAGPRGGRHLTVFSPAGPEGWFLEAHALARQEGYDAPAIDALFEKYGMTRFTESH